MTAPLKLSLLEDLHAYHGAQRGEMAGWSIPLSYGDPVEERQACMEKLGVVDLTAWNRFTIEGQTAAHPILEAVGDLPVGTGRTTGLAGIYRLREDQFFLHFRPGEAPDLSGAALASNGAAERRVTTTDMSHGWCEIGLLGPGSPQLLARLCGLDFHDSTFPDHSAARSSVAKTVQLVLRHDLGQVRFYSLIGDRSLGPYLWKTIFQAGRDLNAAPIGLKTLQMLAVRHPVFRIESI